MKIIFNGNSSQIDANTLLATLGHYQFIMEEANKEMGGAKTVSLKINAIEKGSFVIDVSVVESALRSLFSSSSLGYVSSIITIVGGVYGAYKYFKGRPVKTPEQEEKIKVLGKDNVVITRSIINIYNQVPIREAISKTIEAADKDENVDGLTIDSPADSVHFPREEFSELIHKNFSSLDMLPPDRSFEERAHLYIVSMSFESGYLWQFLYKGFKISIRVKEGPLMKIIDRGERFGKGDMIEVTLEITQRYNPDIRAYENVRFRIKEFHRHIPAAADPSLFD